MNLYKINVSGYRHYIIAESMSDALIRAEEKFDRAVIGIKLIEENVD